MEPCVFGEESYRVIADHDDVCDDVCVDDLMLTLNDLDLTLKIVAVVAQLEYVGNWFALFFD